MLVEPVLLCSFARRILDDGGGAMRGDPVIAIQLLVYILSAWSIYAILASWARKGGMLRPMVASMILIAWLATVPYGLLFPLVRLSHQIYMICPSFGGWDNGFAFVIWLGMLLSYPVGLLVGIWGVRRFFKTKSDDEAVEHVN